MTNQPVTRCKFYITAIEKLEAPYEGSQVYLSTCYDETIPEDVSFTKYTPSGEIKVHITNEAVLEKLAQGLYYYVDFTPVPQAA